MVYRMFFLSLKNFCSVFLVHQNPKKTFKNIVMTFKKLFSRKKIPGFFQPWI